MQLKIMLKENENKAVVNSNFGFNSDKYPADYCIIFDGSEVISVFNFVMGTCALSR